MKKSTLISEENKLTLNEVDRIFALYQKDPNSEQLKLEQLQHITTDDIFKVCSAYDSEPLCRCKKSDWKISRGNIQIDIRLPKDGIAYHIDLTNGNVFTSENGRLLGTGCNASVIHFFLQKNYAIPVYFGIGHWANRKFPFDLGIAIPDTQLLNKLLSEIFNQDTQEINDWYTDKLFRGVNLNKLGSYNNTIQDLCIEHKLDINKLL